IFNRINFQGYIMNEIVDQIINQMQNLMPQLQDTKEFLNIKCFNLIDSENINQQGISGDTILIFAVKTGNLKLVEYLINQKGADINQQDKWLRTPLMASAAFGHIDILKLLIEKSANLLGADDNGRTVLHYASTYHQLDIIKILCDERKMDINMVDLNDYIPLSEAIRGYGYFCEMIQNGNYLNTIKYLVENKSNLDHSDNNGFTLVMLAASLGRKEVIELLFEKGAKIDIKDKQGNTALIYAIKNNHFLIAEWLIEKNVNIDWINALSMFVEFNNIEAAKFILNKFKDFSSKDKHGFTVLHQACKSNNKEFLEFISNYSKEKFKKIIDDIDNSGKTPLHYAAQIIDGEENISILLHNGADVNKKDNEGVTPLMIASESKIVNNVLLLLDNGADVNEKDKRGRSSFMWTTIWSKKPKDYDYKVANLIEIEIKLRMNFTKENTKYKKLLDLYDDIFKQLISKKQVNSNLNIDEQIINIVKEFPLSFLTKEEIEKRLLWSCKFYIYERFKNKVKEESLEKLNEALIPFRKNSLMLNSLLFSYNNRIMQNLLKQSVKAPISEEIVNVYTCNRVDIPSTPPISEIKDNYENRYKLM
ncbi:MAG: hypothetical protein JWM09_1047, partial [Francisellaceae bacterium]|nr:hypothetical protein [Francisellaceae bacterium]